MSDISVRALGEDEWQTYRSVRLEALQESPDAFVADHTDEADEGEDFWRARMARSARLIAEVADEDRPVGVVSIGDTADEDAEDAGQLFGLWVAPQWRGRSVAASLVRRGSEVALERGVRHLYYWVGTENARGVAFASSFGFRPTDDRRPMRTKKDDPEAEQEIAMVLALGEDRR
ncbi:GNAT family N-acetyltransferase [Janibacter alkaliphilus]|uniref:Ribosomal protein S18 acetylase RimI-like enzyme n=1 Tax=Janibacter alkaliphilus TaxID=1069963 RepID=A0A852X6N7_9MICO|nr:GNAT family N-acetyltransferase [Janibacter alkaliphilus]NYG35904.1 ribosomal protein S18 acetylase RimI-like enzyme [Janibacter alkaliphilus]